MHAAKNMVDAASLARLTSQTRNLLAFYLELGVTDLPATPELRAFLADRNPTESPSGKEREVETKKPVKSAGVSAGVTVKKLEEISRDISSCRLCGAATGSRVEWQGDVVPRLFVVGDYCRTTDDSADVIWGIEEDGLFWKMMAAIGLDKEAVYVTNCIKCDQDKNMHRHDTAGRNCFSFLERELAAMEPGLICAMGELATSLLLGSQAPLVRLRGTFHSYRYPHGGRALVMPTFHPHFLLRHPEMKRASWMDLQALQRKF